MITKVLLTDQKILLLVRMAGDLGMAMHSLLITMIAQSLKQATSRNTQIQIHLLHRKFPRRSLHSLSSYPFRRP